MFININNNQCISYRILAPTGFMDVINKGGYIATFSIGYYLRKNFFGFDSPKLKFNKSFRIAIPATASSILFLVRFYLTPTQTRVICRKEYPSSFRKYIELGGTFFKPSCTEIGSNQICIF